MDLWLRKQIGMRNPLYFQQISLGFEYGAFPYYLNKLGLVNFDGCIEQLDKFGNSKVMIAAVLNQQQYFCAVSAAGGGKFNSLCNSQNGSKELSLTRLIHSLRGP